MAAIRVLLTCIYTDAQRRVAGPGALAASAHVRASAQGDGLVLLDIDKGFVLTCNHTGRRIWQGLTSGRTPAALVAELSREYVLPEEQIGRHIASFIADLRKYDLLIVKARC